MFYKKMATVTWVVFRHHKKTDGTYNPKIRITHNRTSCYVATNIYTKMVRFKKDMSFGTVTNEVEKSVLDEIVNKYRTILNQLGDSISLCDSAKDLIAIINRKMEGERVMFLDFAFKDVERIKNDGSMNVRKSRLRSLWNYLNSIGMEDIAINNITPSFLMSYEKWLRSERTIRVSRNRIPVDMRSEPLNNTGIHGYLNNIKFFINRAKLEYNDYDRDVIVIRADPFKKYTPPRPIVPVKKAVSAEVIRKIYAYHSTDRKREVARDLFILSFALAGINSIDLSRLTIVGDRVEYERKKTSEQRADRAFISIKIHPIAAELIEKYRDGDKLRIGMFSELSRRSFLSYHLRAISAEMGIPTITYYAARHSFATIARNDCGISKDDISLALNHSQNKTVTDVYLKPDWSVVDNVVEKVMAFVFG